MAEFGAVGEHWVLPNVDSNADDTVRMHVSVCVGSEAKFAEGDIDLAVRANDSTLEQTSRPGVDSPLAYVSTRAITAVAFFTFANPDNLTPAQARVTLLGESLDFTLGPLANQGDGPLIV
jgi:hypothetical protein